VRFAYSAGPPPRKISRSVRRRIPCLSRGVLDSIIFASNKSAVIAYHKHNHQDSTHFASNGTTLLQRLLAWSVRPPKLSEYRAVPNTILRSNEPSLRQPHIFIAYGANRIPPPSSICSSIGKRQASDSSSRVLASIPKAMKCVVSTPIPATPLRTASPDRATCRLRLALAGDTSRRASACHISRMQLVWDKQFFVLGRWYSTPGNIWPFRTSEVIGQWWG
jgi:hypothetical protein